MSWPRLIGVIVKILEEQPALYSAPYEEKLSGEGHIAQVSSSTCDYPMETAAIFSRKYGADTPLGLRHHAVGGLPLAQRGR
jgi:hypothetical protein